MLRNSHYWTCAAAMVGLLGQPALGSAHIAHWRHHAAFAYRHRVASARPMQDSAQYNGAQYYGAFGGYADAAASAQYAGPNARRYFDVVVNGHSELQGLIEQQASANGVPVSLVEHVIKRESGGNARAANAGNYGLMQIRLGTARAMGYSGSAAGLLDAQTNMTYAVKYLAGAYRAAGGSESRAVALYARGYNAPRVQEASYFTSTPSYSAPTQSFAARRRSLAASKPSFSGSGYGGAGAAGPTLVAYVAPGARERARHVH